MIRMDCPATFRPRARHAEFRMRSTRRWLMATLLLGAIAPALAAPAHKKPAIAAAAAGNHKSKVAAYLHARRAYEEAAGNYWKSISEKRSGRFAKRRNNEAVALDDYVLTQPPQYTGPPRPPGTPAPP